MINVKDYKKLQETENKTLMKLKYIQKEIKLRIDNLLCTLE